MEAHLWQYLCTIFADSQTGKSPPSKDGSPPLAVLNTFEAAKNHFQHYKPTFSTIKGKAHLWQS